MLIKDMTRDASIDLLNRTSVGRLACARDGQPYITPLHWKHDDGYLYSFSTLGQKIAWMRENPLVCVEFEELANSQDWATVIVSGTYEELPDLPQYQEFRQHAFDLLHRRSMWWEPGYVKSVHADQQRPMEPLYFRVNIDRITGHRGIPDAASGSQ